MTALAVGGPSSGVLPLSMFDTPIRPGLLHDSGVMLGAGGIIAIDGSVGVLDVVRNLADYNADESCGKCTPCREGTPRIVAALDRVMSGDGSPSDLDELRYLAEVVNSASLCGLGQAAGNPINSALHFFGFFHTSASPISWSIAPMRDSISSMRCSSRSVFILRSFESIDAGFVARCASRSRCST